VTGMTWDGATDTGSFTFVDPLDAARARRQVGQGLLPLGAQKLTSGTVSITPALPLPPVNGIQDVVRDVLTLRYDQYQGQLPYRPTVYGETLAFIGGATVLRPTPPALAAHARVQLDVGVRRGVAIELTSAQIARASAGATDAGRFIVMATASGRLQRFNGERWVPIPRDPLRPGRPNFARLAAEREIRPGDTLRWIPAASRRQAVPAFRIRGWDGVRTTATSSLVSLVPGVAST